MKQTKSQLVLVDGSPQLAKHRRELRGAYLKELKLTATDSNAIDKRIGEHIRCVKSLRAKALAGADVRRFRPRHLGEIMAIFLLGSEPDGRALRVQKACEQAGAPLNSTLTLLRLLLTAFGPDPQENRRSRSRDARVLNYMIAKGKTPSALISHLTTVQGVDATYRKAILFFGRGSKTKTKKVAIWAKPSAFQSLEKLPPNCSLIAYVKNTAAGPIMVSCTTNPSTISAFMKFVNRPSTR
jgi:hypothetical protein